MHELGIANSVVEAVRAEALRHPHARPRRVGVRLGEWAGVDADALRFCFEVLVRDSDLGEVSIDIDNVPRRNRCSACLEDFLVIEYETHCPRCGAAATETVTGHELELAFVELEDG